MAKQVDKGKVRSGIATGQDKAFIADLLHSALVGNVVEFNPENPKHAIRFAKFADRLICRVFYNSGETLTDVIDWYYGGQDES